MAEKKEKQWAVVQYHLRKNENGHTDLGGVHRIQWFDARKDAREFADKKNKSKTLSKRFHFGVLPMTRGPRA